MILRIFIALAISALSLSAQTTPIARYATPVELIVTGISSASGGAWTTGATNANDGYGMLYARCDACGMVTNSDRSILMPASGMGRYVAVIKPPPGGWGTVSGGGNVFNAGASTANRILKFVNSDTTNVVQSLVTAEDGGTAATNTAFYIQNSASTPLLLIRRDGRIATGRSDPTLMNDEFEVLRTRTSVSENTYANRTTWTLDVPSNAFQFAAGLHEVIIPEGNTADFTGLLRGTYSYVNHLGDGTVTEAASHYPIIRVENGLIESAYSWKDSVIADNGGRIRDLYHLYVTPGIGMTNEYGLYVGNLTGASGFKYAIYVSGNQPSYIGGTMTHNNDVSLNTGAQLFLDDGDVTAPGLTWGNDPNTGLFRISSDTQGFVIGGTLRLILDSAGQIIGTNGLVLTTISGALQLKTDASGNDNVKADPGGTGNFIATPDANGSIGIGTETPAAKVDITKSSGTNYAAVVRLTAANVQTGFSLFNTSVSYSNPFTSATATGFNTGDPTNATFVAGMYIDSTASGAMTLIGNSQDTGTPAMRFNGNWGTPSTTAGAFQFNAVQSNGSGGKTSVTGLNPILLLENDGTDVMSYFGAGQLRTHQGSRGNMNPQSGTYQILITDEYVASTSTSAKTLPDASDVGAGTRVIVKSVGVATTTTLNAASGDTVEGAASLTINPNDAFIFRSDGVTNWQIVGDFDSGDSDGTVTSVSSGDVAGMFDVSVANPTTTPAFTFAPIDQGETAAFIWDNTANVFTNMLFGTGLTYTSGTRTLSGNVGTVTSFSSGNIGGVFTANVATATSTPALTFTAIDQNETALFGWDNTANTFTNVLIGSGLSYTSATRTLAATGGSGTVTSIGIALEGGSGDEIYSVTGSPVTTSGNIAMGLNDQVQKTFFAGPTSGGDDSPTFRAIELTDLPSIASDTFYGSDGGGTPTALTVTSPLQITGGALNISAVDGTAITKSLDANPLNATALFTVSLPSAGMSGVWITGTVQVSDSTPEYQSYTFSADIAVVNKSGTFSQDVTQSAGAFGGSAGGMVPIVTVTDNGSNTYTVNLTHGTDLMGTITAVFKYSIKNNTGHTITPL